MAEKQVVVYCRSWCPDCRRALFWLDTHGIAYEEIDIEEQPEAAETCRRLAGKIVTPTFTIDDEVVVDFNEARLSELLLD